MLIIDSSLPLNDPENCKLQAAELIYKVRNDWAGKALQFKFYTSGITNQVLSAWQKNGEDRDRVMIRIYGNNTELIINREYEMKTWQKLAESGCASKVYGLYNNGVLYEYLPGVPLTVDNVADKHMSSLTARAMAKLHMVGRNSLPAGQKSADFLWMKIRSFLKHMPESFEDPVKQKRLTEEFPSKNEIELAIGKVRAELEALDSEIVMCHNDLLINNILYDKVTDYIHFIDYEYAGFNHQCFDIANHFVEYAGVDDYDFSRYPEADHQRYWLTEYLNEWHKLNNRPQSDENQVQRLYVQVNKAAHVPHFFWCIWALVQAEHSTIDFDFLDYAVERYVNFKKLRARFADLTL